MRSVNLLKSHNLVNFGDHGNNLHTVNFSNCSKLGPHDTARVDPHDGRAVDFPSPVGYNRPRQNLEKPAISRRFGFARRIALFIKTSF